MTRRTITEEDKKIVLKELFSSGKPYSVIYVGISGMLEAMEEFGEELAPRLVEVVSRRVQRCVRGEDSAIAVSPDQYALVIKGVYDIDVFKSLQGRVSATVEKDVVIDDKVASFSVDFGTAAFPEDGSGFSEVIDHARMAMERAQRSRSRLEVHEEAQATRIQEERGDYRLEHADPLTGLLGSVAFRNRVMEAVEASADHPDNLAVVFCDIEKFKEFNLKFGYSAGDDLLKFMADTLEDEFEGDIVARLNSDRFGILTRVEDLAERLDRAHDRIRLFKVSSSIEFKAGVCYLADANMDATIAQDYARLACDSTKGRFDQVVRVFDERLASEVRRRQHIVDNLDTAIDEGWIEVYYQPIVRSVTEEICGLEALCRWNDPEFGILPPGEFIDVLEEAHLIHKLDLCMVRQVCADGRAVMDAGRQCVNRSINLSRLDYQLCDIFTLVDEIVTESGFPREKIHIEFTESAFTQDAEFFTSVISRFHEAGYGVWMDDFGSGYSSLNLLKDYNFDVLKIDMVFLRGLEDNPRTRDIVSSVVDMAKKLGIQTLAEGVETKQQYLFLKSIGCEMLQGYLFSRPIPIDEIEQRAEIGEFHLEDAQASEYYNKIGHVNMLSPSPFETADERSSTIEFTSGIPLAVVERRGDEASIIVANEVFMTEALETDLVNSMSDNIIKFNKRGEKLAEKVIDLADLAKESGTVEFLDFYNFKELYTLRLMHIAEQGERDAYLVSLNKYETTNELARRQATREKSSDLVYLPERQDTPWQQSDELDLAKTAVIVVDILGGTEGITPGLEDMAANGVAIVKAARAAGMPIIFNNDAHIKGLDQELELWGDHGVRGTPSGTPLVEFDLAPTDFIIPKRRYNGFFQTDLELTLRELGMSTLIMVGGDTNICVLQTLAGAYFYGYKTVVPSDGVATFLIGTQEAGLEYFSRCYDTRITTTYDLLQRINTYAENLSLDAGQGAAV